MKTALLLLAQLGMALVYLGVSPSPFGLTQENPHGFLSLWRESIELISIPFCLLLFSFSRKPLFVLSKAAWGFWSAFVSWGVLGFTPELQSQVPFPGILFLAFFGILGFSLALHAGFEGMHHFKVLAPNLHSPSEISGQSWPTSSPQTETLPKVEGV